MSQRQDDFQQRVIAATLPHDPTLSLASQVLRDEPQRIDEDDVFYPATPEEFEQMLSLWEADSPG